MSLFFLVEGGMTEINSHHFYAAIHLGGEKIYCWHLFVTEEQKMKLFLGSLGNINAVIFWGLQFHFCHVER